MFAIAHGKKTGLLHLIGDAALFSLWFALAASILSLVAGLYYWRAKHDIILYQRAKGAVIFSLYALPFVLLTFWQAAGHYVFFVSASVVGIVLSGTALWYLFRSLPNKITKLLPRSLRMA